MIEQQICLIQSKILNSTLSDRKIDDTMTDEVKKQTLKHMSRKMDELLETINNMAKGMESVYIDCEEVKRSNELRDQKIQAQDKRIDELMDALEKIYKHNVKLTRKK